VYATDLVLSVTAEVTVTTLRPFEITVKGT